jgi:hypothetical protein
MHDDRNEPIIPSLEELRALATAVSQEMLSASDSEAEAITGTGGGSRQRALPGELRVRFIAVRAALFQRGVYDPVLVRFDTATVPQASTRQIAEELAKLAESL